MQVELATGQVWKLGNGTLARVGVETSEGYPLTDMADRTRVFAYRRGAWPQTEFSGGLRDPVELIRDEQGFTIWRGGEQPAETKGRTVRIRFADGGDCDEPADEVRWDYQFKGQGGDIVAYKIVDTVTVRRSDNDDVEQITTDAAALAAETLSALGWRFDGQAWVQDTPKDASALDVQIGGSHYKSLAIQPMEYSMANKLDACQHTIIKYVTRFRDKGGIGDLKKARHTIDMLIEFEGKQS